LSADNRCLPGAEFHFTIPVAVRASGHSGSDHPVVSRQSMFAWASIPFHDTFSRSGLMGGLVQFSPLSADNRCLPGAEFHFTIPVAVRASGYSGADQPVVSRQSSSLGSDFHFTIPVVVQASGYSGAVQPVVSRQLLRCAEMDF
ncbi:hypothetical protein, partial [Aeromonas caviae]|uniref:hypothetical protein n=1 Tax=Aeromonas caviae TaxID=648 RepID=UPI002B473665